MKKFTIKGKGKGRKILLIGGLHGDELTPYVLLNKLKNKSIPAGETTVIPFANRYGLKKRQHGYNKSNRDLNRQFQENDIQPIKVLKDTIDDSYDLVIDLHAHQYTKTIPYAVVFDNAKNHEQLDKYIGKLGIQYKEIIDTEKNASRISGTLSNYVSSLGIPNFIIELSNLDNIREDYLNDLSDLFTNLCGPTIPTSKKIFANLRKVNAQQDMLVEKLHTELGQKIKKGQKLFNAWDLENDNEIVVRSIYNGTVISLPTKTIFHKGYGCYRIAVK